MRRAAAHVPLPLTRTAQLASGRASTDAITGQRFPSSGRRRPTTRRLVLRLRPGVASLLATVPVISPLGSCSRRFFLTMGGEGVDDQHAYEDIG